MPHPADDVPLSVSVENEFPQDLFDAMRHFIRTHPEWDQYRLMHSALAGFLFQHGCHDRAVARHYLDGLFNRSGSEQPHLYAAGARSEGSAAGGQGRRQQGR